MKSFGTLADMQQAVEFEALYLAYWRYIYKYEVGYEGDFRPDVPWYKRDEFKEQLHDEGMTIKVRDGY
jgi:hypothetical protein